MTKPLFPGWDLDESDPAPDPEAVPDSFQDAADHNRRGEELRDEVRRYQAEVERLTIQRNERIAPLLEELAAHEVAVETWHRQALRAGAAGIGKTVDFPTGPPSKLVAQGTPAAEVHDEEALRVWAMENDLEDTLWPAKPAPKPTMSKAALKEALGMESKKGVEPGASLRYVHPETGEVVPGVRARVLDNRWEKKPRQI